MKNCHGRMFNEIGPDEIADETMDFFCRPDEAARVAVGSHTKENNRAP